MNFKFFMISILLASSLIGSAFALDAHVWQDEFSQEELDEMKGKAVLITMNDGDFMIELFPEDAPNTVSNFLKLVEDGYYDGIVFHRIIPGFMIQAGDPNTKDPEKRMQWGQGGPGWVVKAEFNAIQHDRGIVSMARSGHPDSAGSQFFIVHKDSPHLDNEYTAFGRLVLGSDSINLLDIITQIKTDDADAPTDVSKATIVKAYVLDNFSTEGLIGPDRNAFAVKPTKVFGGWAETYNNYLYDVKFDLPYRWDIISQTGDDFFTAVNGVTTKNFSAIMEPNYLEHNVQEAIKVSEFTPQVMVFSEPRIHSEESSEVATSFFSIRNAGDHKVLSNYIFQNDAGMKAHMVLSTQTLQTEEATNFKIIQLHFNNLDTSYSVVYINVEEFFRYEVPAFLQVVQNFEVKFDGRLQPINFADHPVFKQLITDAKVQPEPEALPPARIGGCLIATASYGSELAPQVQLLREIRDNTVLQTQSGSSFLNGFNQFYYSFSPTIADYERENPAFKEAVKLTLTPLLTSLTLLQYVDIDSESEMLGYGIAIILLNIGMYFIAPAVLITKIRSFYKLQ